MPPLRSVATRSHVERSAVSSASGSLPLVTVRTRWRVLWTSRSHAPWPGTASLTRARPRGMSKASRSKRSRSAASASGGALIVRSGRERPADALGHACRLLRPLDLDREPRGDLVPAVADLLDGDDLG